MFQINLACESVDCHTAEPFTTKIEIIIMLRQIIENKKTPEEQGCPSQAPILGQFPVIYLILSDNNYPSHSRTRSHARATICHLKFPGDRVVQQ